MSEKQASNEDSSKTGLLSKKGVVRVAGVAGVAGIEGLGTVILGFHSACIGHAKPGGHNSRFNIVVGDLVLLVLLELDQAGMQVPESLSGPER